MSKQLIGRPQGPEPTIFETSDTEEDETISSKTQKKDRTNCKDQAAEIDTSDVDPVQAFEFFLGRRYDLAHSQRKAAIKAGTSNQHPREIVYEYNALETKKTVKRLETPMERFYRLSNELDELKSDLEQIQQSDGSLTDKNTAQKDSLWTELHHQTDQLRTQLSSINPTSTNKSEHTTTVQSPSQELSPRKQLEIRLQQEKSEISELITQLRSLVGQASSTTSQTDSVESTETTSIQQQQDTVTSSQKALVALESRISQLEAMIGVYTMKTDLSDASGIDTTSMGSLNAQIVSLQNKLNVLDPKHLELALRHTKQLRREVEQLERASTNTPNNQTLQNSTQNSDITMAMERLEKWDSMSNALPDIVERLRSLRWLHTEAALFTERIAALESGHSMIQNELQNDVQVVQTLQQSLHEAIQTTLDNFAKLKAT